MSTHPSSRLFRFGLFEADLENACLTRQGVRIRLQDQPFRILRKLLEHPGQIVTREDLRRELWSTGTYVSFDPSLNMALNRLRAALGDDADNPRFIETIPKRGYRFIAPVITEAPAVPDRFERPTLSPVPPPSVPADPADMRAPRLTVAKRNWMLTFSAAALLIALAVSVWLAKRGSPASVSAKGKSADIGSLRHSVAVLAFENTSGRPSDNWLSTALAEMLRTELGAGDKLSVVPGENVAQFRAGAPWSETDSLNRQTASRIGKALGSDLLVLGSFATVGDPQNASIRVDFRLQDAQTGEILYEGAESATKEQFFGLVATVGADLRHRLDIPAISESEEAGVVSSLPSDPDANRFYSLGLEKSRDGNLAAAKDLFLQAEKIAPEFPLVHLMLSRAWSGLGYDKNSQNEIQTAYRLSSGLPQTEQLQIEGAYYQSVKNPDKAISAYRALYSLYPESVDYAQLLIGALADATRLQEALAIVDQLRKLPPPASQDPRIDFWQAELYGRLGNPDAGEYFQKGAAEAAARGQKLLYAQFRLNQCVQLVYGDRPQGGAAYCKEAYDIFMAAGNRLYAADALRTMGDRMGATGNLDDARELYNQALAILRPLGEHEKTGVVLNNMATGYENQGQITEAQKLFREAADTWTECGDLLNAGIALGNLGDVSMLRGQLNEAELQYERARRQIESADPIGSAYLLYSIAYIRLLRGDIPGAKQYSDQAMTVAVRRRNVNEIAEDSETIGAIRIAADDLPGARQSFEQALNIRKQQANEAGVAEMEADLASVALEEGKFPDAEQALKKSLAEFRAGNSVLNEIEAETDLSRALLREGKLVDARQTINDALTLSHSFTDPDLKLPAVIMDARIEAVELAARTSAKSNANYTVPRRKLLDVIETAHRLGYLGIEYDGRLALAELELRENLASARARLAELAHEAKQHGMGLIARKATLLSADGITPGNDSVSDLR
jgi:DNA-binding winged helix-turn-helix (wHTH) protein/Tfp pilus assembly protein PilF/TolB-like protein